MPAKKTTRRKTTKRPRTTKKKQDFKYTKNIIGFAVALLALFALLRLGVAGVFLANILSIFVGNTNQVLAIILIAIGVFVGITGKWPKLPAKRVIGGLLVYLGVLVYDHLRLFTSLNYHAHFVSLTWGMLGDNLAGGTLNGKVGGGMIAAYVYAGSEHLVANLGTAIFSTILLFVGAMFLLNIPFAVIGHGIVVTCQHLVMWTKQGSSRLHDFIYAAVEKNATPDQPIDAQSTEPEQSQPESQTTSTAPKRAHRATRRPVETADSVAPKTPAAPVITVAADQNEESAPAPKQEELDLGDQSEDLSDYKLPTPDLLTKIPQTDQTDELNAIEKNSQTLQKTLASFGVDAEVKNVSLGPSVTKYELHPAIGVKVSKIVNLADDLALALAAKDIRIEAPIPGKSLIGIEVPNKQISTVSFRDVAEHEPAHPGKVLSVPLGRDVTGNIVMCDLTKMPHLLIAGSTGSGKSVAINGIITSLLMQAKPNEVKFMLIDPKRVELSVYNDIPHLLTPVVSEPKRAAKALHKVVDEMTRRYELFANFGVRNIDGYNKLVEQNNANSEDNVAQTRLPYVVAIVDELADLMMTVSSEVEDAIIRIAQMGRAAGIHMILATQRPSVDVITGLIKANVPSRIAFAVSSGIDSRTILDANGAEKLLGRGDMLFEPIDQNKPTRVQGEFISDKDVAAVVDFIKQQQTAEYDGSMEVSDEELKEDSDEDRADEVDELYNDAVAFVQDQQKASTSLLQRRFRIGYNRAARMIDDMEARGIVGPADGSRPRQVFSKNDA